MLQECVRSALVASARVSACGSSRCTTSTTAPCSTSCSSPLFSQQAEVLARYAPRTPTTATHHYSHDCCLYLFLLLAPPPRRPPPPRPLAHVRAAWPAEGAQKNKKSAVVATPTQPQCVVVIATHSRTSAADIIYQHVTSTNARTTGSARSGQLARKRGKKQATMILCSALPRPPPTHCLPGWAVRADERRNATAINNSREDEEQVFLDQRNNN